MRPQRRRDIARIGRTRIRPRRNEHLARNRCHSVRHRRDVLPRERPEQQRRVRQPEILAQRRDHPFRRIAVVRAVHYDQRLVPQHLQPPWPHHIRKPRADMRSRQLGPARRSERLARHDRCRRIVQLMASRQRQLRIVRCARRLQLEPLPLRRRRRARQLTDLRHFDRRRTALRRDCPKHIQRRLPLRRNHNSSALNNDPRLLRSDRRDRVPKNRRMLQTNRRQHHNVSGQLPLAFPRRPTTDDRRPTKHIRRIQQSAKPHFDDLHIDTGLAKRDKTRRSQRIERQKLPPHKLRPDRIDRLTHKRHRRGEAIALDRLPRNADPFVVSMQMRTDVVTGAHPGRNKHTFDHRAGAALALRPGDMHRRPPAMRLAQLGQQRQHRRNIRPSSKVARPLKIRQRQQPPQRPVVVHTRRVPKPRRGTPPATPIA